jgi:4-hydroxybenzoate polyprenyltransferase
VKFQLVFVTYYGLTLAYSLFLKGQVLIDTLVLAGLYTLRLVAGAAAAGLALSFWLLLFSVFLFLSLAFVKRYAELDSLRRRHQLKAAGRGYHIEDLSILRSLGTAAGYLSVLVLALYINSPEVQVLYHKPKVIWLLCIALLYWISRIWVIAERGNLHDDPVVYALKDRMSLLTGLVAVITVVLAI